MVETLTVVESLLSSQRGDHEVQVVHVILVAEDRLLDQGDASIVELMATGLGIAKQVTGRISVTAVENEAILKEIVKTVPRN